MQHDRAAVGIDQVRGRERIGGEPERAAPILTDEERWQIAGVLAMLALVVVREVATSGDETNRGLAETDRVEVQTVVPGGSP